MKKLFLLFKRQDIFFDLVVGNSLGCKFLTTNNEETQKIKRILLTKKTMI